MNTAEKMFELEGYIKCSVSPNGEPPAYSMSKDGYDYFINFDERTQTFYSFGVGESADVKPVSIGFKLLYAIMAQFAELGWMQ